MKKTIMLSSLLLLMGSGAPAFAASGNAPASASPASILGAKGPADGALVPYDKFAAEATAQKGLFTVWRSKDGNVALELSPTQFNTDFVEMAIPQNGIGAGLFSGLTDLQNCRIVRFVKQDDRVAIVFPTTRFLAQANTPEALAVAAGTANSVAGVAKVLSVDDKTGDVVFDASPFLADITDVGDLLTDLNGGKELNPLGAYRLNPAETYFGQTKSFPENITIVAAQTFSTLNPQYIPDAATDPHNLQIDLQYTIAALPKDDGYVPRLYDDRVGYFVNAHDDFSSDDSFDKSANYIVRWNLARGPVVYYLSNTIPLRYRAPIRKALLTWNNAFRAMGYPNAVVVKDQPNDPTFDPDDMRYNVVRWLTETQGGFAEAQLLYNPYTGEMLKSGIVIDSDLMRFGKFQYPVLVEGKSEQPSLTARALGADYAAGERRQFSYGMAALSIVDGIDPYHVPKKFADEFLESIVLHESGHDWGLRHNFVGSEAYTQAQLRSPSFTEHQGIASSVMEYSPINLWPKGKGQGEYFQTVLGPYDYYVIHWGYAKIPGAKTPEDELPVLRRWASAWSNPLYKWSSDEDVMWRNGAAVDPSNQQWDLSNDNVGWCQTQMTMARDLLRKADTRFPRREGSFDDLQSAVGTLLGTYASCADIVGRYVGGEYVSRARRGDPHAALPLSDVSKAQEARAFKVLESNVFASSAWDYSPNLLRQAVTQYRYDDWDGNLVPRHDIPVEEIAKEVQDGTLERIFAPVTLQRLDDMPAKYGNSTMDIADLFTWMQSAIYGDVSHPRRGDIPLVRRNLQRDYASVLSRLANAPPLGTPQDAQALSRYELGELHGQIARSLATNRLDLLTHAHLASLDEDVERALHAQAVITTR